MSSFLKFLVSSGDASSSRRHKHPYYPREVVVPNYAPNTYTLPMVLGAFGGATALLMVGTVAIGKKVNKQLTWKDAGVLAWFTLCGFLHCFFEGYYVLNHATLASKQDIFAQLWKEYALSDSRYMTSDPFMLCIETLTVLTWGPLSFLAVFAIIKGNTSLRHITQTIVSVGHLYGVALYFGTCFFQEKFRGISYSRPETLYYWVYYAGMNAPWVIVPAILLFQSSKTISQGLSVLNKVKSMKGGSSSTSGSGSSSSIYSGKAESIRSFDGSSESKSSNSSSSSSRKADKESKREPSRDSRDGGERRRDRVSEQAAYFRDEGRPESIAESKYEIWEENRADAREQLRKKRTTGRRE
ncbi:EBP-domain-containing protein [Neurospora crassa]|uniref:EBDP2 n=1 Tax=Neurospora crassa (strain ATCC 24698 / 74-OR23-1A / CBS 708.71 / DSM 1257 / FGSC 987) TaxID=367110 RepID=Q7RZL9_NEUCR|nr:EBDP2 [Neurospora crassa OR74A]EAA28581.2 EBDP2 [Neurospora crassa OR74A]KHE89548.1 EBP-domain-containing protein [Neurospora crassa]|eukprot:XP_957817.2 EBDP2 [Neurospora crassa OR74A]